MKKALLMAPMGSVHRRFNQANIDALLTLGYEVHLAANFEAGEGPEKQNPSYLKAEKKRGLILHHIPYKRHSFFGNIPCIKPTKKLIHEGGFAVVHTHTETGGLMLRLAGTCKETKYIYTSHGFSFYKGAPLKNQLIYRPIEKWICAGMTINIAINREDFTIQNQWNRETSRFVHGTGLNFERFSKNLVDSAMVRRALGVPEKAKMLLSIGELDDNKNHKIVIEALGKIHRKDLCYVICGVGKRRKALSELAVRLGLKDQVILAGYRKDIPDIICASDLFIFPSYHEGLPASLMEAMAGGLPVVCSDIRGVRDLIQNGENGQLIHPNRSADFKEGIENILSDDAIRNKYIEGSKEIVRAYTYERVKSELLALYEMS